MWCDFGNLTLLFSVEMEFSTVTFHRRSSRRGDVLPLYKALYLTFTLTTKASTRQLSVLRDVNT